MSVRDLCSLSWVRQRDETTKLTESVGAIVGGKEGTDVGEPDGAKLVLGGCESWGGRVGEKVVGFCQS